jgi:MFS family permease
MASIAEGMQPHVKVLGLVSAGHFMSHFYSMSIPPLMPFLHDDLNISYTLIGLMLSAKSMTSGLLQLPAGMMVDRYGAKVILSVGLLMCAVGMALLGIADSWAMLVLAVVVMAMGNCVFHPADYSILTGSMDERYMGRSFSIHTFAGHLGNAVAPAVLLTVAVYWSWRASLLLSAAIGVLIFLGLATQWGQMRDEAVPAKRKKKKAPGEAAAADQSLSNWQIMLQVLRSPPLLFLFFFFTMSSLAQGGLKNFSVAALEAVHDTNLSIAGSALTGFLFASAFGVLVGGWVADRWQRHDLVAAASLFTCGAIVLLVGGIDLHWFVLIFTFTVAGTISGIIRPARDMMIRNSSPKGSAGKAFGFVYSGEFIGGGVAPALYGFLLDVGKPEWIFYSSAVFFVMCGMMFLGSGRATRAAQTA